MSTDSRRSLGPPQFGLRTLLWLVTACAVLLAAAHWLEMSPLLVGGLLFFAVAIALHVVGNAIGTRLREIGDCPEAPLRENGGAHFRRPRPEDFAPVTRLSAKQSLGWVISAFTYPRSSKMAVCQTPS